MSKASHKLKLSAVILSFSFLLTACGGGGGGGSIPDKDTIPPVITKTQPASGELVKTQSNIALTFNEAISLGVLGNVDIYPFTNGRLDKTRAILLRENTPFTLDTSGKELTIHLFIDSTNITNPRTLQTAKKYQVNIQGIRDKIGNPMVGSCRFEFATTGYQGAFTSGNTGICDTPEPRTQPAKFIFKSDLSSVVENVSGGKLTIIVQRDVSSGAMSVDYSTADGSAVSTGVEKDFIAKNDTLYFSDGVATQPITIDLVNDTLCEGSENFTVNLSNPSQGSSLSTITKHTVTIESNDGGEINKPGTVGFKTLTSNVNEGAGSIDIIVSRTVGCSGNVSVDVKTNAGGKATAVNDFIAVPLTTLTFKPGVTEQKITVNIVDDSIMKEGYEDFSLSLSNPVGGAVLEVAANLLHTITIVDNDILSLNFGIKQLKFNWVVYPGTVKPGTSYRLMKRTVGAGLGTAPIDSNYPILTIKNPDNTETLTKIIDVSIHRHDWLNNIYYLETCVIDCIKSNEVVTLNKSTSAIGYFKSNNPKDGDRFGGTLGRDTVLAVSGDGNTLAVGATLEDNIASSVINNLANYADNTVVGNDSGAVYIFARDTKTGTWAQQAYIKASNSNGGDNFGNVTLSFNGSTLAVGADNEESPASFNTVINTSGTIAFPTTTTDTVSTADSTIGNHGAVYVFTRTNGMWSQQAYIKASNGNAGDRFGKSVSLSGDGSILAVGAHYESSKFKGVSKFSSTDNTVAGSGAVYIYTRDATSKNWSETAYVKANNTGGLFGNSVIFSRDGSTFAVGAPGEKSKATGVLNGSTNSSTDVSLSNAGAAYIFKHSTYSPGWYQDAYIKANNTSGGNYFGNQVALSGDGITLVVTAQDEDSSATGVINDPNNFPLPPVSTTTPTVIGTGAVYVYSLIISGTASNWSQSAYIKSMNTTPQLPVGSAIAVGDQLGSSLALSSDGNTIAVGAIYEDSDILGVINNSINFLTQTNDNNLISTSGAVYVFNRNSGIWSQSSYVKSSNTGSRDQFGATVSLSNDGSTLAIGTRREDGGVPGVSTIPDTVNNAKDAGAVYLY